MLGLVGSEVEETGNAGGCEFRWWEEVLAVFGVIGGAQDWIFWYGLVEVSMVEVVAGGGLGAFVGEVPEEAWFFRFDDPATDLGVTGAHLLGNFDEGYFVMFKGLFEF